MKRLRRWSALVFLFPERYVEPAGFEDFDLHEWSRETFEWRREGQWPWQDTVQETAETLLSGRGDCDDYALLAASWSLAHGHTGVGLAVMGHYAAHVLPRPTHMVAYDAVHVYSSGRIVRGTPQAFVADSDRYDWVVCNGIDG